MEYSRITAQGIYMLASAREVKCEFKPKFKKLSNRGVTSEIIV